MKFRVMKEKDVRKVFLLGKPYFASKSEYSWIGVFKRLSHT
jgi:hypothetical protein